MYREVIEKYKDKLATGGPLSWSDFGDEFAKYTLTPKSFMFLYRQAMGISPFNRDVFALVLAQHPDTWAGKMAGELLAIVNEENQPA